MQYLVSGSSSGLGRYLRERLGGEAVSRAPVAAPAGGDDTVVIHCAFNTSRPGTPADLAAVVEDNILLTRRMLDVSHAWFVFVSSVDVYPPSDRVHAEDEAIDPTSVSGMYGLTKLMCEALVRRYARRCLILRPSALLGPYMKPNSLVRVLCQPGGSITLSPDSTFNYVRHAQVADFIETCLARGHDGVFNVASREQVRLGDAAASFGRALAFGSYTYATPILDTSRAEAVAPGLFATSANNIQAFVDQDLPKVRERHGLSES